MAETSRKVEYPMVKQQSQTRSRIEEEHSSHSLQILDHKEPKDRRVLNRIIVFGVLEVMSGLEGGVRMSHLVC
jgi:hypothetical protein